MPTVPVSVESTDATSATTTTGAVYDWQWAISVNGPASAAGAGLMPFSAFGAVLERPHQCTVFDSSFDNSLGGSVLANTNDAQGCAVTVRDSGPFLVAGVQLPFSAEDLWLMSLDVTYPDSWDDGNVAALLVWAVATINVNDSSGAPVTYKRVFVGSTTMPFFQAGSGMVSSGHRTFTMDLQPLTVPPRGYSDDSSVEVFAGVADTSGLSQVPAYDLLTNFYYHRQYRPANPGAAAFIRYGDGWSIPALPAVEKFVFSWGDGEPDDEVAAAKITDPYGDTRDAFLTAAAASHDYEDESAGAYFRAVDIYGRKSAKVFIKTRQPITGENHLSTTHNIHGELFIAQTKRAPDPVGISVKRSPTSSAVAAQVSFIANGKKPGIYHNSDNQLFLGYIDPATGYFNLYSTPDSGETWELMTTSPFDTTAYAPIVPCNGMSDGLHAVAAFQRRTANIWFSLFDGADWSTPKLIFSTGSGSKVISFFQENFAGSSRLRIVSAGLDMNSTDYGVTWNSTSSS